MLSRLRTLFQKTPASSEAIHRVDQPAPSVLTLAGLPEFDFAGSSEQHEGLPAPDWLRIHEWLTSVPIDTLPHDAWPTVQRAWALQLRDALGPTYEVTESAGTILLSALPAKQRDALINYVDKSRQRIGRLLRGIAMPGDAEKSLVFVFEDADTYYRYVSRYYPDDGDFALSGGMHINAGCSHFVTTRGDLTLIEPIIVHELTHALVAHLPIPVWLNEGLAVNTERRLAPTPADFSPAEIDAMHRAYWTPVTIQDFWSGQVFHASGDGNRLAYELGRQLTEHLSSDWSTFEAFVNDASASDSGYAAALKHYSLDLGEAVRLTFDSPEGAHWAPQPEGWTAVQQAQARGPS